MAAEPSAPSVEFLPPSISEHLENLCTGRSYAHYSQIPAEVTHSVIAADANELGTPCVLGVDEAGRGPVIGPMVYGVFYLPIELHQSLLSSTHHFDDSKVLTPAVREDLMKKVCTDGTDLYRSCGWAIKSLSAQDISAGMMKNGGSYNLNAQAMDATIEIIRHVIDSGVNIREIYVDTIGSPIVYQRKLERVFPTVSITVEKKADSLYPCVSAASVVAKVTRDISCERLYSDYLQAGGQLPNEGASWGSGYPSDSRCVTWMKSSMDPVFGWGSECRFSWGTSKDMLEAKDGIGKKTDWPDDAEDDNQKLSQYFSATVENVARTETDELRDWYGQKAGTEVF